MWAMYPDSAASLNIRENGWHLLHKVICIRPTSEPNCLCP